MKKILAFSLIIISLFSCEKNINDNGFQYPESKIWKHQVNTVEEMKHVQKIFDGVEIDVFYCVEKDDIYVGHEYADTVNNLLFDELLSSVKRANKMCYWIDFKFLQEKDIDRAFDIFNTIVDKYNIHDKIFVESYDYNVLCTAKKNNYYTMLWVESLSYRRNVTLEDSISVIKNIRKRIDKINPDAISSMFTMFPILCDSFPEQNIHFWDTPKSYTPENVEFTKKLCQDESVKIVLVDYPNPIKY